MNLQEMEVHWTPLSAFVLFSRMFGSACKQARPITISHFEPGCPNILDRIASRNFSRTNSHLQGEMRRREGPMVPEDSAHKKRTFIDSTLCNSQA
jgi:hypothetical protein